jgi:hypothetical protein
VPPWDRTAVRAYDRSGTQLTLEEVDAEPPEETLDGGPES